MIHIGEFKSYRKYCKICSKNKVSPLSFTDWKVRFDESNRAERSRGFWDHVMEPFGVDVRAILIIAGLPAVLITIFLHN